MWQGVMQKMRAEADRQWKERRKKRRCVPWPTLDPLFLRDHTSTSGGRCPAGQSCCGLWGSGIMMRHADDPFVLSCV